MHVCLSHLSFLGVKVYNIKHNLNFLVLFDRQTSKKKIVVKNLILYKFIYQANLTTDQANVGGCVIVKWEFSALAPVNYNDINIFLEKINKNIEKFFGFLFYCKPPHTSPC